LTLAIRFARTVLAVAAAFGDRIRRCADRQACFLTGCVPWIFLADTAPQRRRRRRVDNILAIAAAAGLIVGGGLESRIGQAMLAIVGRIALQSAATSFIAGIIGGTHENGNNSTRLTVKDMTTEEEDFPGIRMNKNEARRDSPQHVDRGQLRSSSARDGPSSRPSLSRAIPLPLRWWRRLAFSSAQPIRIA